MFYLSTAVTLFYMRLNIVLFNIVNKYYKRLFRNRILIPYTGPVCGVIQINTIIYLGTFEVKKFYIFLSEFYIV